MHSPQAKSRKPFQRKAYGSMDVTGLEPVTPTMSTWVDAPETALLKSLSGFLIFTQTQPRPSKRRDRGDALYRIQCRL